MDAAHFIELLTVLVLAVFVGFEVISKVPTTLHTPLMSATNAIHGIVLAGAIVIVAALVGAGVHSALLTDSRRRGRHAWRDQRLRRIRRNRTHAADVPAQGAGQVTATAIGLRSPIWSPSRSSSTVFTS